MKIVQFLLGYIEYIIGIKFREKALKENRREIGKTIFRGLLILLLSLFILKWLGQL